MKLVPDWQPFAGKYLPFTLWADRKKSPYSLLQPSMFMVNIKYLR
jgi:hypothetical protein